MARRRRKTEDEEWEDDDGAVKTPPDSKKQDQNQYAITELGQVAPAVPIKWIDIDPGEWPYPNPEMEFIASPFPLDINTLAHRWEGYWKLHEIEVLYAKDSWAAKRFKYQNDLIQAALKDSLANDANFQTSIINDDIMKATAILDKIVGDIQQGVEYKNSRNAGAYGYVKMPMTPDTLVKLSNAFVAVDNVRATRVGLAIEIKKRQHDVGDNLAELMRQRRASSDPNYRALLERSGLTASIVVSSDGDKLEEPVLDMVDELKNRPLGHDEVFEGELVNNNGISH